VFVYGARRGCCYATIFFATSMALPTSVGGERPRLVRRSWLALTGVPAESRDWRVCCATAHGAGQPSQLHDRCAAWTSCSRPGQERSTGPAPGCHATAWSPPHKESWLITASSRISATSALPLRPTISDQLDVQVLSELVGLARVFGAPNLSHAARSRSSSQRAGLGPERGLIARLWDLAVRATSVCR